MYIYIHIYIYTHIYICIYILYIGTQSRCTKRWKQSSAIKQRLENPFLAIQMCTGFTTDGIYVNTMFAVPLANHLRAVGDAFRPLRTYQRY